jgi:alpha-beta hydrolase superfamily lysophospholipase
LSEVFHTCLNQHQIPTNGRKLPLVFWHGYGQSSKTWETTPDGRDGFQNIFLRRGFSVYVIDQPRRGKAGRSSQPITTTPVPDEQKWFNIFRVGIWTEFFPGVCVWQWQGFGLTL